MTDQREVPANDRVVAAWLSDQYPDLVPIEPERCFVKVPVLDLSLSQFGNRDRQLLYGDCFEVLERRGQRAFGLSRAAEYVGWVDEASLAPINARGEASHRVLVRQTHAYSSPDFKSPELLPLPHLSLLCAGRQENRFTETEAGWVPTAHLGSFRESDPVAVAEMYLGTPYLWGGNSCFGVDCSGLVKNALLAATGEDCPGDSDLQETRLGEPLVDETPLRRGDLLFWKGHVAWVSDPETVIHANAFHMAVTYEPLHDALRRIEAGGDGPVTSRKRL